MNTICLLCHESTPKKIALCDDCEKYLPYSNDINFTPYFNKSVVLFDYTFPIDKLITGLKFQHQLIYANLFGQLLCDKIILSYHNQPLPELLIPIPLHSKRLSERGFNQALEIAKPISKKLKIRIDKTSCYRIRNTAAQSGLSQTDRLKNLKNAFEIKKNIMAKHIALIDDVMTTGQTLSELTHILYKNGVSKIDIWCCARTTRASVA